MLEAVEQRTRKEAAAVLCSSHWPLPSEKEIFKSSVRDLVTGYSQVEQGGVFDVRYQVLAHQSSVEEEISQQIRVHSLIVWLSRVEENVATARHEVAFGQQLMKLCVSVFLVF